MNWNSKCNPFGNFDDPYPPADKWPDKPKRVRYLLWYFWRNPMHNFTFYWMGIADKSFASMGKYPYDVFSPIGGWNWAIRKHKWLRLPFISYLGWCKFYIGWRERGNWGLKFVPNWKYLLEKTRRS